MDDLGDLPPLAGRTNLVNPVTLRELVDGASFQIDVQEYDLNEESEGELEAEIDREEDYHNPIKNTRIEVINGEVNVIRKNNRVLRVDPGETLQPFEELKKKMIDISDDGGVLKQVLHKGNGIKIEVGSRVYLHYYATYEGASEPFDSTITRRKSEAVDVGSSRYLLGFQTAVLSMEINEVSRFIMRCDYMYGEYGCAPRIPPKVDLFYTIEVVKYVPKNSLNSIWYWNAEKVASMEYEYIYAECNKLKAKANYDYKEKSFSKAIKGYRRAAEVIESYGNLNEEEEKKRDFLLFQLYVNTAQGYIKMNKWEQACVASKTALRVHTDSDNPDYKNLKYKALFRFAQAKYHLGDTQGSSDLNKRAAILDPLNSDVVEFQKKIEAQFRQERIQEKLLAQKMMKFK